ncbi:PH domain-containing protein [Streptomyces sp. NPDC005811]|uniref:PH domain-containing protein n=1 Tax=Streptomyces sp. NPDC005811 TaxID=3154565 RepID=UPI0034042C72
MTTPEDQPSAQPPDPEFDDRVHRSSAGIGSGVLLLALVGWLGIDAIVAGEGRTPWLALALLILVVPLVVAFTLRPAVYAGQDRLRVRNPFRVVVLPWGQVAALRSGYSNEVVAKSGTKFQLWAVPVSLRARKSAARREARAAAQGTPGSGSGGDGRGSGRSGRGGRTGFGGFGGPSPAAGQGPVRAASDQVMDDLRNLWEGRENAESAQGEVTVRWAWEILGPAAAGAVVLAILVAMG